MDELYYLRVLFGYFSFAVIMCSDKSNFKEKGLSSIFTLHSIAMGQSREQQHEAILLLQ